MGEITLGVGAGLVTGRAFGPSGHRDFPTGIIGRDNGRDNRDFGDTVLNPFAERKTSTFTAKVHSKIKLTPKSASK